MVRPKGVDERRMGIETGEKVVVPLLITLGRVVLRLLD